MAARALLATVRAGLPALVAVPSGRAVPVQAAAALPPARRRRVRVLRQVPGRAQVQALAQPARRVARARARVRVRVRVRVVPPLAVGQGLPRAAPRVRAPRMPRFALVSK